MQAASLAAWISANALPAPSGPRMPVMWKTVVPSPGSYVRYISAAPEAASALPPASRMPLVSPSSCMRRMPSPARSRDSQSDSASSGLAARTTKTPAMHAGSTPASPRRLYAMAALLRRSARRNSLLASCTGEKCHICMASSISLPSRVISSAEYWSSLSTTNIRYGCSCTVTGPQ